MLDELFELHAETTYGIDLSFRRYLYPHIKWDSRLIAIVGARGVGKTTLLLQHYKENFKSPEDCLYLSADNIKVAGLGLFNIASEFFKLGGRLLIIDEIHKYPNWSVELKNIYDSFPKGRIAISGSSTLDIIKGKSDLSRRVVMYHLRGLSFREYLSLETKHSFDLYNIQNIIKNHSAIASGVQEKLRVLKHFRNYLRYGYYPFYLEDKDTYTLKLANVMEKVISEDIPAVYGVKAHSLHILRKLIFLIATSPPFIPNIVKMSSQLNTSKEYIYNYLEYLEKAGILASLHPKARGFKLVRKAAKIYLENPNIFHAVLSETGFRSEIGAIRESFFLNQLRQHHKVCAGEKGDFLVDEKFTFEIGGKSKGKKQIGKLKNSFIAADDIEVGAQNKIPLWLFGFMY